MTLSFDTIDNLLKELPKDINKKIYEYYDNQCKECGLELRECIKCDFYFHSYHCCFRHEVCSICSGASCPYSRMNSKYCLCDESFVCKDCFYSDLDEIEKSFYSSPPSPPLNERDHTDLYEDMWRNYWLGFTE